VKQRGIKKQVIGGKILETFGIETDKDGNKVVTGRRNFKDKDERVRVSKGVKGK
jgi:hypothetical protein